MRKKMLFFIICCLMTFSSFTYASTQDINVSLFLGDTINLKTYLENNNYDLVLGDSTNLQNANSRIVSIDEAFNIETHAVGKTIVFIENNDDLTPVNITVKSTIKEILIPTDNLVLLLGEIYPFDYTIVYHDGYTGPTQQGIKWSAEPTNIAGFKDLNKIYSHRIGQTKLTGTAPDGSTSITLNVQVINNPDYLALKPSILDNTIKVGEKRQIQAFFGTKDVTHLVKWESEFPEFIDVDQNGNLIPLREGSSKITAEPSIERRKKSYSFNVVSMIKGITLDKKAIQFDSVGDQAQINATLIYKNPEEKALLDGYYYESLNPQVATVTSDGLITAQGAGITLIKAISNDSGKWTACTVEVMNDEKATSIDYTLVREVELSSYNDSFLIGDKIPINYKITPADATNQSVRFNLIDEDNSQIHLIDGQYYFVPEKRGLFHLEILADNEKKDMVEIIVQSPLVSMELDLSTNADDRTENKLYIGEQAEILTDFHTLGHYTSFDVYPSTLEYDVDAPDILKLESINGRHYVTALKAGKTFVRAENLEGRYDEAIEVRVVNPAEKLYTHNLIEMPLDIFYTPQVTYKPTASTKDYEPFDVSKSVRFNIEEFYFEEAYVDAEIDYERKIISVLKKSAFDPTVASSMERHQERLDKLFNLKRGASKGYCLLKNNHLKDRNFEVYRYVTIDNNKIAGHYPSKALVSVSLAGSATSTMTEFYWKNDKSLFKLKDGRQTRSHVDILKDNNLQPLLSTLSTEDQIKYTSYYLSNKALFDTRPSKELLAGLMNLEGAGLPRTIISDFNGLTTKEELAYVAMFLEDRYTKRPVYDTNSILYFDVNSERVKQALAKSYITPVSEDVLGGETIITYSEFKSVADKLLPTNTLPATLDGPLTHEQLILLLNQLN